MLTDNPPIDSHDLGHLLLCLVVEEVEHDRLALPLRERAADEGHDRRKQLLGALAPAVAQALVFIIFVPDSRRSHDAPTGLFDRLRDLGFDVGPEEAVLVATVERVAKPGTRVTTFAG